MLPDEHRGYPEPGGREFTSGHSGTDTSRDRALSESRSGTTKHRQQETLERLRVRGYRGITVKELREATGWHHGQASATLSNLHKAGEIVRLTEVRDRCKVYVLPGNVLTGQTVEAFAPRVQSGLNLDAIDWELHRFDVYWCRCGVRIDRDEEGNLRKDGAAERFWVEHVLGTVRDG